jgi:hypothetical protein
MAVEGRRHYAERMLRHAFSSRWRFPVLAVVAGLVGWQFGTRVLHVVGPLDPFMYLAAVILALLAFAISAFSLWMWLRQANLTSSVRWRSYGNVELAILRRTLTWSIVALACSVPFALLILVLAGPTPWMGGLFAAVIGLPQILIWFRLLSETATRGHL